VGIVQTFCTKKWSFFAKTILKGVSNDENSSESDDEEDTTTDDEANITNDDDEDFSDRFQVAMAEKDATIELTDDL
jgi:hypothetical protein